MSLSDREHVILVVMTTVRPQILIALGSNIEAETNLPQAARMLARLLEIVALSAVYESPPVGSPESPPFLNAVIAVGSRLGPRSLKFGVLRDIESRLGRRRQRDRNAPRTIDLDLVLYGECVETAHDLTLPDPDLSIQPHVAVPAAEVAGQLAHPRTGLSLAESAATLESRLTERPDVKLL